MKIKLTFKTPDVLDYAIDGMDEDSQEEVKELAKKFIEFGEYLTIELDTENSTARVIPTNE